MCYERMCILGAVVHEAVPGICYVSRASEPKPLARGCLFDGLDVCFSDRYSSVAFRDGGSVLEGRQKV